VRTASGYVRRRGIRGAAARRARATAPFVGLTCGRRTDMDPDRGVKLVASCGLARGRFSRSRRPTAASSSTPLGRVPSGVEWSGVEMMGAEKEAVW
jgi:hypothetical protein